MALHSYKQGEFSDTLVEKQRNGFLGSEFLDTRWSGVGAHMGDHELEEGEACDDPDSGCDPDTAFAYLEEKLSMVLGDVQKFFEGGVSAEKLGSKFGGYGSFLPTQERTPSILHQDKPATVVAGDAYCRTKKSSNEGMVEKIKRTAAGSSVRASNFKAGSSSAVLIHENGGRDAGHVNEKMGNVESSFPAGRIEENMGPAKKPVVLRIKMGSDTSEKKKNTTIYSDFGLGNTSSDDEDADDDQRTDSDLDSSPDRTPLTMIRIMTSHHIPDGMLLSPLPDLVTEPFMQKERMWSTHQESLNDKARSPCSKKMDIRHELDLVKDDGDAFEKMDNLREKTKDHASERKGDSAVSSDHVSKKVKGEKERGGLRESRHTSKPPSRAFAKDFTKSNEMAVERQARDAVSESGTGVRSIDSHKEFKGSSLLAKVPPDYPPYEAEHDPKDFCSPFQPPKEVDSGREPLSRGYRVEKAAASSSHDSMNEHLDMSHQGRDAGTEVFNSLETNLHGRRHLDSCAEPTDVRKRSSAKEFAVPFEGKTRLSQDAKISTSKGVTGKFSFPVGDFPITNRELGREVPEARKRSKESVKEANVSRGSSKERGKDASKDARKSSGKEKHIKPSSSRDLVGDEAPKEGPPHTFKAIVKDFQEVDLPKVHKTESVDHHNKRKEKLKERTRSDYPCKESTKLSEKDRQKDLAMREVSTKASQPVPCVPETVNSDKPSQPGALPPPLTDTSIPPSYVMITDHWVACDKCGKWRLLPPGVDEGHLPTKWWCKMLNWLEGMNNCSVPEEVTTQATQALKNIAAAIPPPIQENPPVVEQIQPPASVMPSLPPPSANLSQETKFLDKTRAAGNKKRKIPPITSVDAAVQSKSKGLADASQATQEASQAKLGDANTAQEKIQVKSGGPDLGHVKAGEEKRKVKEREKAKRFRPNDGASPFGKEHSQTPASLALREARDLKHHGDRLKGKERAGTLIYLQAALKFLQAASMLESEGSEYGESKNGPLKIYADTATLCEYCATTYERIKDLAAAALAYKCAGLARMRVVQAKSLSISKDRAEVQSTHHQAAPGESPSSSTAIDVDTFNNSSMDKLPARGAASPLSNSQSEGSCIITAKSRPSFNRILQYVADTNAAVDALSKSHNAFTAAELTSMYSSEGMSALKRVLEFSFHDVESLVRLVRIALEAMGHY